MRPSRPSRVACPATVMNRNVKSDDRERDVRGGPGADRDEALPGRRLPVRVRAERVAELGEALLGRGARGGRDASAPRSASSRSSSASSAAVEVVALERALDAVDRAAERRRVLDRPREAPLGVVRDRAVHPRDRHEAAERDRADRRTRCPCASSSRSRAGSRCRSGAAAARRRATRRSARPRGRG